MTVVSSPANELDTTADVRDVVGIRWRLFAVCTLAALSFWLRYISDPMRPGAIFPLGWYEQWFDQTQYYDILVHIPQGTPVSYTHLRAHETPEHLVCRLLLEK